MESSNSRYVKRAGVVSVRFAIFLTLIGMTMMGAGACAQPRGEESVLRSLWSDPGASQSLFSEGFLQQVPFARTAEIVTDFAAKCGTLEAVRVSDRPGRYTLQTARCELPTAIHLDPEGKIAGFWFGAPARRGTSVDEVLGALRHFDGAVSYAVFENGNLIASHAPDESLAVGSAFKVVVLAALRERIEAREARWADVLELSARHISLPSGRLHRMPLGSPLTLHTLAAAMIAQSDNTATDMLIEFVGRERLEAMSGASPFLTTREFFQLKSDVALYERYAAAEPAARRALLETLSERPLPGVGQVRRPLQPHAGWRISTAALCGWMEKVEDLGATQINSGPLDESDWARVSFKGGSDIGVLNLTASARDRTGRALCVSATWNATEPIEEARLVEHFATLFVSLRELPG